MSERVRARDPLLFPEAVVLAGLGALGHGVEPVSPIGVRPIWNGGEVELRCVPTADAVVGAEVPLIVAESVGFGAVPLGVHEHIRALLVDEPRDGARNGIRVVCHLALAVEIGPEYLHCIPIFIHRFGGNERKMCLIDPFTFTQWEIPEAEAEEGITKDVYAKRHFTQTTDGHRTDDRGTATASAER